MFIPKNYSLFVPIFMSVTSLLICRLPWNPLERCSPSRLLLPSHGTIHHVLLNSVFTSNCQLNPKSHLTRLYLIVCYLIRKHILSDCLFWCWPLLLFSAQIRGQKTSTICQNLPSTCLIWSTNTARLIHLIIIYVWFHAILAGFVASWFIKFKIFTV